MHIWYDPTYMTEAEAKAQLADYNIAPVTFDENRISLPDDTGMANLRNCMRDSGHALSTSNEPVTDEAYNLLMGTQ